jgi:arabinofuranan 3-O-arabinosyltransferase
MEQNAPASALARLGPFVLRRRVRAVLAWAAVFVVAGLFFYSAWTGYDRPNHPQGNIGHVYIDFSGQWLMGRMLVRGEGSFLYDKAHLYQALREAYQPDDAATIDGWLIESKERPGVGGPLYPPIEALLCYPLGLLPPQPAYRIVQVVNFSLTFVIGFLAWKLTRGRLWASVAVGVLMAFPGYGGAISLGQNSLLSLALLLLGWLLMDRGRPWSGGVVWGLLAFKPVWAVTFFVVPLLMRRWRVCVAMALTGIALILLTLPFVGWQTWLDWLTVGRAASAHYAIDEPWIFLSRDLLGVPRRYLLHFTDNVATDSNRLLPDRLGLGLWLTVAALTIFVGLWRWPRPAGFSGTPAVFLLLGAWLSCFHFMYYDVLLAALPVYLLLEDPIHRRWASGGRKLPDLSTRSGAALRPPLALLALFFLVPHIADGIDYLVTNGRPIFHSPPFDTFILLALWAWCGWQWLREPISPTAVAE